MGLGARSADHWLVLMTMMMTVCHMLVGQTVEIPSFTEVHHTLRERILSFVVDEKIIFDQWRRDKA